MTATISISMENYLETIFHLVREHTVARVKDIADRRKASRSSVTGMLQALRDHPFVNDEPYGFVTLTPEGAAVAKRVVRRHEALRDFMVEALSIDAEPADEAACHMEHGISRQVVDRFLDFAAFVQTCPQAGAKWIDGFGYRCAEAAEAPGDWKCRIETCHGSVKERRDTGQMQDRRMRTGTERAFFLTSMFGSPNPVSADDLGEGGESGTAPGMTGTGKRNGKRAYNP